MNNKMSKKVPNINARDVATILGINPYQTPFQLLEDKIEHKYPFFGNKFTIHGNRYESDALSVFENHIGNEIDTKQSNRKHPNYPFITGRFDGVIENIKPIKRRKLENNMSDNRTIVVEIKCPLKKDRPEPLSKDNIPKHYWSQIQVYMNMLDCEYGYYVEFYIEPDQKIESGNLHYIKVERDRKWWDESLPKILHFYEEIKHYHELGNLDTHSVRVAENKWKSELGI